MKKLLVISPHFPPVNAPDHQRVRMMLPHLRGFGWEPTVLAVHPDDVESARDARLTETYPADIEVEFLRVLSPRWTRRIGLGSLALRALPAYMKRGAALAASKGFDLAFFSTTAFPTMALGPCWKRRFGLPYVLDFQDPWLNDHYEKSHLPPPGGKLKHGVMMALARRLEPLAVVHASHLISVSPAYPSILASRYPEAASIPASVIPFGAAEADPAIAYGVPVSELPFDPNDGRRHWVYIGRGGVDMARALRLLFEAVRDLLADQPGLAEVLRLHFIGTSYAANGKGTPTILPIAKEFRLGQIVSEITDRIPYFSALALMQQCDVTMLIGSDDQGYTASKLYPCILAGRPLLGIFHEASSVVRIARDCNAGEIATFGPPAAGEAQTKAELARMVRQFSHERPAAPQTNWQAFAPFTARAMTERLAQVFDQTLEGARL